MNKKLLISAGVLAVAGIAYYMWKKKNSETTETTGATEEKANALGRFGYSRGVSTPRFSAPIVSAGTVGVSTAVSPIINVSKIKKGDSWFDSSRKECCYAYQDGYFRCSPAPCTLSSN